MTGSLPVRSLQLNRPRDGLGRSDVRYSLKRTGSSNDMRLRLLTMPVFVAMVDAGVMIFVSQVM
jgi:hypothetical protein